MNVFCCGECANTLPNLGQCNVLYASDEVWSLLCIPCTCQVRPNPSVGIQDAAVFLRLVSLNAEQGPEPGEIVSAISLHVVREQLPALATRLRL